MTSIIIVTRHAKEAMKSLLISVFLLALTSSLGLLRPHSAPKSAGIYCSSKSEGVVPKSPTATFLDISLGEGYKDINVKFMPVFEQSTIFSVTFDVPFGLNIDKPPKGFPCPIVTKDGSNGEKKGDILRATTCWSQGFSAAGPMSDIMQFAGNVKWRKSLFDCTGAPYQQIVDALISNIPERSKTVTLVFERETSGSL